MAKIVDVCVYKKSSSLNYEDLIVDLDQYNGSYDYNEENLVIVGTDANGKTWLLDFDENIIGESDEKFSEDQLLGEACDLDRALKVMDDLIVANLDFEYMGTLLWDGFPAAEVFA